MLSERSQTQKDTHCLVPQTEVLEADPQRQEVDGGARDWGRGQGVSVSWGQSFSLGR